MLQDEEKTEISDGEKEIESFVGKLDETNEPSKEIIFTVAKKAGLWTLLVCINGVRFALASAEGASVFYSTYTILSYYVPYRSPLYYIAIIGAGPGIVGNIEIVKRCSRLSDATYHKVLITKEAIAGATVAAKYIEGFFESNPTTVAACGSTFIALTALKILVDANQHRQFFKTPNGQIANFSVQSFFSLMIGAGISDYLLAICEGFGAQVDPHVKNAIYALLSFTSLIAVQAKSVDQRSTISKGGRLWRSFMYGSDITLYMFIMILNFVYDVHELENLKNPGLISNLGFYLPLGISLGTGALAMTVKYINNHHEETRDQLLKIEEITSEKDIEDQVDRPLLVKPETKTPSTWQWVTSCFCSFWYSKEELKVQQLSRALANVNDSESPRGYSSLDENVRDRSLQILASGEVMNDNDSLNSSYAHNN